MTMPYVDTNIFIRYFTQDEPIQAKKAALFIDAVIDGKQEIAVLDVVVVEMVHVLSSKRLYSLPRVQVRKMLESLIILKTVKVSNKGRLIRALEVYEQSNLDFIDCILAATVEQVPDAVLYSFEAEYRKFPQITWVSL